jgi:hypothetical protein
MLEFRSIPSSSLRSSTSSNWFTKSLSNSDNSFETAKLVGTLRASSSPINIRAKGVVGQSDRVDVFKFKVLPGANFPSYTDVSTVSGGKLKVAIYWQHPDFTDGQIRFVGSRTLTGSSSLFDDNNPTSNTSFDPITAYIRVSTTNKNVKYEIKTTYNPS